MRFFILGHTLGPPVEWQAMLHGQGRMLRGVRVRGVGIVCSGGAFSFTSHARGSPGGSVPAARFAWGAHAAPRASSGAPAGGMRRIRVTHNIGTEATRPDCRPSREGARRDTRGRVWSPYAPGRPGARGGNRLERGAFSFSGHERGPPGGSVPAFLRGPGGPFMGSTGFLSFETPGRAAADSVGSSGAGRAVARVRR